MDVSDVIARMREIDDELPASDGVAVFNRMYLTVTERIAAALESRQVFEDQELMAELDVRFARLFLSAYDAAETPTAWAPLFESRHRRDLLPVQFALAGMNTHIEHDLPLAVVQTCRARDREPDQVQQDYEAVNRLLAEVEEGVRRSFLDTFQQAVDDEIGPVVHLVSSWNIDKARDVAWTTALTLWELRRATVIARAFEQSLAHTVGLASRLLLTPG